MVQKTLFFRGFSSVFQPNRVVQPKDRLFWVASNICLQSPSFLRKIIFWPIFAFFLRGYIVYFCEKWSKLNIFRFKCQYIGNLTTSSTRYDTPHSDLWLHCDSQNTDILGVKKRIIILAKNIIFSRGFLIVVWPNPSVHLKDRLFWAACFLC